MVAVFVFVAVVLAVAGLTVSVSSVGFVATAKVVGGGVLVLIYAALVAINLHNGELAAAGLLAASAASAALLWN